MHQTNSFVESNTFNTFNGNVLKQPPEVFHKKKVFLKVSLIGTGKHLCQCLFLNKVAGPDLKISQKSQENTWARVSLLIKLKAQACDFIKKETLAQLSPVNPDKCLRNLFYRTTPGNFF